MSFDDSTNAETCYLKSAPFSCLRQADPRTIHAHRQSDEASDNIALGDDRYRTAYAASRSAVPIKVAAERSVGYLRCRTGRRGGCDDEVTPRAGFLRNTTTPTVPTAWISFKGLCVIIDRGHRGWMLITLGLLAVATALYVWYVQISPDGPRGGSIPGLAFGFAGSALMLVAGLLSAKKKLPRWSLGSARMWLKGHIWLGLLSVPLILFHAGFRWGGLIEQLLLLVLGLVVFSGLFGLILQQYLPRVMRTELPAEAMFNQVPVVCARLRDAADAEITAACAPTTAIQSEAEWRLHVQRLREFYLSTVRPFLSGEAIDDSPLANASRLTALFVQVREALPVEFAPRIDRLEAFCHERRQLAMQLRMRGWLHGWLIVHIPLSMTLLVLGIVHAIMSVYY
jgi:hypothetical protein